MQIAIIANCDCEKNTISQITQFSFVSVGRNHNTTQFDFQEGRNCENYYIGDFFEKNGQSKVDSRSPEFLKFKFHIWGSTFRRSFCPKSSWFIPIKNRNRKIRNFRKKHKLRFAIFATFAICEIVVFAISQITQSDFEPVLQLWSSLYRNNRMWLLEFPRVSQIILK